MEFKNFNNMMLLYTKKIDNILKDDPNADEMTLHTDKLKTDINFLSILDDFFAGFLKKGKIDESQLEKMSINDIAYNCYFCYLNKKNIEIIEKEDVIIPEEFVSNDSVKEYLKAIGSKPLLTPEEELILAKKIELSKQAKKSTSINQTYSDKYINELAEKIVKGNIARKNFSNTENKISARKKIFDGETAKKILFINQDIKNRDMLKLAKYIYEGNQASNEFIERNMRLVISVAKKYVGKGLDFLDLIQEGNIGLCKATERFDLKKGFKFSTYATWWIRQGITRALADQGRTIRIPVHMCEAINKVKKFEGDYMREHDGNEPTIDEIASALEMSKSTIETIKKAMLYSEPVSLETPIGPEDDSKLEDFIQDKNTLVEEHALKGVTIDKVNQVLRTLNPREEEVIRLRFGLNEEQRRYTLEEVGKVFDVTRERIRQIEAKALRKLRGPNRTRMLGYDFREETKFPSPKGPIF